MPSSTKFNFLPVRPARRASSMLAAGLACALALCGAAQASQIIGTGIGAVLKSSGTTPAPSRTVPGGGASTTRAPTKTAPASAAHK